MSPIFLNLSEVLQIHLDQIEKYGGNPGIRDLALLQSALAMPAAGYGGRYLHESLFEMAAAYLFHLVRNHPFVDGNKRTAVVSALIFLEFNNIKIRADVDEFERIVILAASGKVGKDEIAAFLIENRDNG